MDPCECTSDFGRLNIKYLNHWCVRVFRSSYLFSMFFIYDIYPIYLFIFCLVPLFWHTSLIRFKVQNFPIHRHFTILVMFIASCHIWRRRISHACGQLFVLKPSFTATITCYAIPKLRRGSSDGFTAVPVSCHCCVALALAFTAPFLAVTKSLNMRRNFTCLCTILIYSRYPSLVVCRLFLSV